MTEENQPQKSRIAETASGGTSGVAKREEQILAFWQKNSTFKKTLEKKSPKGEFVFYDGPPFATGLPHYGHILAGTIKDVIPRFKTMQGYRVPRRWGWDCHGLPVENEVEKELGFKSKKDIEQYGIAKFNAKAKEAVMRYADDWRRIIPRMGRWVDMNNDYRTMDPSYTESVWWIFKTLHDKGLISQGFKSMHLCPRCETTLSNFEVTQGYKELTDLSVYVKFKLLSQANTYFLAWTTTPWTLPGNAALAVHPEKDYTFAEITASNAKEIPVGDTFIVGAKEEILKRVFGQEAFEFDSASRVGTFTWKGEEVAFSAKKGIKGKELIGQSYEPLFPYYSHGANLSGHDKGWRVYGGEFVTEEDGTGIVHIAPAFGEDDYQLAAKEKLPFIQHVGTDGAMRPEVTDFAGLQAKPKGNPKETDEKIAAALEAKGKLLRRLPITHPYPYCWRCDTPLLNYAAPSWFVKVSEMREKLVAANKGITWVPKEVGEYRFGNWLAEAKDWAISRSRFWGAPIPVWGCERCKTYSVIGSVDDLRKKGAENITKIIIVRHGESEKNVKHILDDSPQGFPLTHEGKRRAKEAAEYIKAQGRVDAVYSSPVQRAKETAAYVARVVGKEVQVEERFREVDSGSWDGLKEGDPRLEKERGAYRALPAEMNYVTKRGETGESWAEVEKRMAEGLKLILQKHAGETIVIVSHEGPMVYFLKAIDTLSLSESDSYFHEARFEAYARPMTVYVHAETCKEIDMHRPFIDEVALTCDTCAKETGTGRGLMRRVPEVFDCWFESGAMPYGQAHYPFDKMERGSAGDMFDPIGSFWRKPKGFPAHFIAEGLDQTRGWFYSMLVLGLGLFGKSPYQASVVNGIILAENGAKMSKRLKNYPDPLEVVGKYGADSLRYYLLSSPVVRGEDLRFSERGVDEVNKKVFGRLDNVLQFYLLYADEKHKAQNTKTKQSTKPKSTNILDIWITTKLNQLIAEVTKALEQYELDKAVRPIGEFVDDLSTWYVRRSRDRIKSDDLNEKEHALGTLRRVLSELAKVMAPFTPFFAEYLYQTIHNANTANTDANTANKSVHMADWPQSGKVDEKELKEMEEVRKIVSLALEARAKVNIKVRQPLQKLKVKSLKLKVNSELTKLIEEEVNVKEVVIDQTIQTEVELDTTMTPELREEGMFRELVRFVQEMRKTQGFKAGEPATLVIGAQGPSRRFIEQREQELSRIASLKNIVMQDSVEGSTPFQADELSVQLSLTRD
ncbi:MAG: Isoleucine-tRNA ligase [Parcubacteria group bacterium GW2011_GWA2_49_9]|nr:MAG: Isoleucine-tRNA ligase [Parcubacteria group bacterium GW2011_GWA2_49_9]